MVPTHTQTKVVKFLFIPFDEVVKPFILAGVDALDQVKIFIFD
jgi:hypothetical protein